ncbi:Integrin beta-1 [Mactra antiquata]
MEFNIYLFVVFMEILVISRISNACDTSACISSNGDICNNNGVCDCGVCTCNVKHSGPTCEEGCDKYAGCVGCKIFGTGPVSIIDCLIHCDEIATYYPVDKKDFDVPQPSDDKKLCQVLNYKYCMESFRIGEMSGGYRDLHVRVEEDCDPKYRPTEPTKPTAVIDVTIDEPEDKTTTQLTTKLGTKLKPTTKVTTIKYEVESNDSNDSNDIDVSKDVKEDTEDDPDKPQENVAPVAGSSRDNTFDSNGTDIVKLSNLCALLISLYYVLS